MTTFDQFLFALRSAKARHQMRFHHLADAVIVLDEVPTMPRPSSSPAVQQYLASGTPRPAQPAKA